MKVHREDLYVIALNELELDYIKRAVDEKDDDDEDVELGASIATALGEFAD